MYRLRVPEIAERMFRGLNLRGKLPEEVQEKFDASITVEDLTTYDYNFLRRAGLYQANVVAVAGGAGTFAIASLRQLQIGGAGASATNVIASIDRVAIRNTTGAALGIGWSLAYPGSGNIATNSSALPRDSRQGTTPIFNIDVPLAATYPVARPTVYGQWFAPANSTTYFPMEVVLGPTGVFSLFQMNAAAGFEALIDYRERAAAESELR